MSKTNTFENDWLKLLFQNVAIAGIGDVAGLLGSTVAGSLYASLHTANPGELADQTSNEAAYTSYARIAIVRSAAGFTVVGNLLTNAAITQWPAATGGDEIEKYWGFGTDLAGTGKLLASGKFLVPMPVVSGRRPRAAIGSLKWIED